MLILTDQLNIYYLFLVIINIIETNKSSKKECH